MALVKSTLNPNAPPFIPAAVQKVEDFSPEWWDLVTTSTWFRNYWLSQHQEDDGFGEDQDVVAMLPDTIDIGVDEDILNMEAQYEEFLQSSISHDSYGSKSADGKIEFPKKEATKGTVGGKLY